MKLEVGMYVRTTYLDDEGYLLEPVIAKIKDMTDYRIYLDDFGDCKEENIIKASNDIIDLIEVGDYVNGYKVIGKDNFSIGINLLNEYEQNWEWLCEEEIQRIVTKEQFKAMEYKIEEGTNEK